MDQEERARLTSTSHADDDSSVEISPVLFSRSKQQRGDSNEADTEEDSKVSRSTAPAAAALSASPLARMTRSGALALKRLSWVVVNAVTLSVSFTATIAGLGLIAFTLYIVLRGGTS